MFKFGSPSGEAAGRTVDDARESGGVFGNESLRGNDWTLANDSERERKEVSVIDFSEGGGLSAAADIGNATPFLG
jgi:hypothetical protein